VHNPRLPANADHFVNREDGAELVVKIARLQHAPELVEQGVVAVFLVLLQILLELASCLPLRLLLFQLRDYSRQLRVLEHAGVAHAGHCVRLESAERADLPRSDHLAI
jgi:hypothetical protein